MKTQYRHPQGILNSLQHISRNAKLFNCLLEAAESFDVCMIRRNTHLSPEQKQFLLDYAMKPLPLRQQCRLYIRKQLGKNVNAKVPELPLPTFLHHYLLYDFI